MPSKSTSITKSLYSENFSASYCKLNAFMEILLDHKWLETVASLVSLFSPMNWLIHFDLVPSQHDVMSYLQRKIYHGWSTLTKESCLLICYFYSVQRNQLEEKLEVALCECFIFVLPSLCIVAEERKSRRYNSTINYNVVCHTMTTILLNFLNCYLPS